MYKLRELEKNDISAINAWRSEKELIDNLGAPFRYISEDVDYKWYDNYLMNRDQNIRCSIINDFNQIIGLVSLTNINRIHQTATFHIMIGDPSNRDKGVGYYATREILKHAFFDMNLNRVELTVLESNQRALSLYERVGFKKEGIKRKAIYKNGKFIDMITMAILKEEFMEVNE